MIMAIMIGTVSFAQANVENNNNGGNAPPTCLNMTIHFGDIFLPKIVIEMSWLNAFGVVAQETWTEDILYGTSVSKNFCTSSGVTKARYCVQVIDSYGRTVLKTGGESDIFGASNDVTIGLNDWGNGTSWCPCYSVKPGIVGDTPLLLINQFMRCGCTAQAV